MLEGRRYPRERNELYDTVTGTYTIKLTGFPVINQKLYFHINHFDPEGRFILFYSENVTERNGGFELFTVSADGNTLIQVTDGKRPCAAVLSYDGRYAYYINSDGFRRVDMQSYKDELVGHLPDGHMKADTGSITEDGRYYYADMRLSGGRFAMVRYDTESGEHFKIFEDTEPITHTQVEPRLGELVAFQRAGDPEGKNIWLISPSGESLRRLDIKTNGHWTWMGLTGKIMSNYPLGDKAIAMIDPAEGPAKTIIADGTHYWHASSSRDGEWIVSDTNWPDEGIKLVNVKTGKAGTICHPRSSCCHPQWTHPHPSLTPDNKKVLFNSDQNKFPHLYIADIPEKLTRELSRED